MDSKFYVSYEAARLLKEKGYNEAVESYYDTLGELNDVRSIFQNSVADNSFLHRFGDYYAAPSKAEAIDWLDSKGIVIIVDEYYIIHEEDDYYTSCWGYYIRKDDEGVCRDNSSEYKTRLEAEEAAIIKALELL